MIKLLVSYKSEDGLKGYTNNLEFVLFNVQAIDNYYKTDIEKLLRQGGWESKIIKAGKYVILVETGETLKNQQFGFMELNSIELGEEYFYSIHTKDKRYIPNKINNAVMQAFYELKETPDLTNIELVEYSGEDLQ